MSNDFNYEFLEKLSNADSIASNESEIRKVLKTELHSYADEITYDNLGSIIFRKKGNTDDLKIMICAHMDEVGFLVNNISPSGLILVTEVGRVKPLAQFMQKVRITTNSGKKIEGILQSTLGPDGTAEKTYIDIGAYTDKEVYELGIDIGDMVTYTTEFKKMDLPNLICGKSMDDRLGCYVIGEVLKRVNAIEHKNDVYVVGTSSEEVGTRGARTATYKVNPDVVFVIDVSCGKDEWNRDFTNRRQIGKGLMLMHNDRTLVPNKKMLNMVKATIKSMNKNAQYDLFVRGATDGAETHKVREGVPTVVMCAPLRYGHCAYSIADINDANDLIDVLVEIIKSFNKEKYNEIINFD